MFGKKRKQHKEAEKVIKQSMANSLIKLEMCKLSNEMLKEGIKALDTQNISHDKQLSINNILHNIDIVNTQLNRLQDLIVLQEWNQAETLLTSVQKLMLHNGKVGSRLLGCKSSTAKLFVESCE